MELPLGSSECICCHMIVSDSDMFKLNQQEPVCESCVVVAIEELKFNGEPCQVSRLYELKQVPAKG